MTRGLTDPVETPQEASGEPGDLPTLAEVDAAIRQLYEMHNEMQVRIQTMIDLVGASIGTNQRSDKLTGL